MFHKILPVTLIQKTASNMNILTCTKNYLDTTKKFLNDNNFPSGRELPAIKKKERKKKNLNLTSVL